MSHSSISLLASTPETQEAPLPAGHCPTVVAKSVSTGDPPMIKTAAGTPLLPQVTAYRQYQLSPRRAHPVPDRSTSARPPAAPPMSHLSIILLVPTPEIQEAPLPAGHRPTVMAAPHDWRPAIEYIGHIAAHYCLTDYVAPSRPFDPIFRQVDLAAPRNLSSATQITAYRQFQLSPRRAHPVSDRSISARPPAAPPMSHPSINLLASNPDIQLSPRRAHHVPDRWTSARPFAVPVRC
jgi:hypothetical protein